MKEIRRKEHTELFISMQIINPSPSIIGAAGHQTTGLVINRRASHLVPEIDFLEQPARGYTVEKVHALPRCNAENPCVVGLYGETVEFACSNWAIDGVLDDRVTSAKVPPSNLAVFRSGCEYIVVLVPDDGLDSSAVDAWTDFVARC